RRGGRLAGLRALGASAREPAALAAEVRWSLAALGARSATIVLAGADGEPALTRAIAAAGVHVVPLAEAARPGGGEIAACAVAAALPGARLAAPRAELDAAVAAATRRATRLGGETGPLEVLRELSARVPPALRLDLDELSIERDGVLLHGRAESFDAVDALRRALSASPLLADVTAGETRTTVDGRGVEFRLRAAR